MIPYKKVTRDSTNSAEGYEREGALFHAQPRSENEPRKRAKVTRPYAQKMEPSVKVRSQEVHLDVKEVIYALIK